MRDVIDVFDASQKALASIEVSLLSQDKIFKAWLTTLNEQFAKLERKEVTNFAILNTQALKKLLLKYSAREATIDKLIAGFKPKDDELDSLYGRFQNDSQSAEKNNDVSLEPSFMLQTGFSYAHERLDADSSCETIGIKKHYNRQLEPIEYAKALHAKAFNLYDQLFRDESLIEKKMTLAYQAANDINEAIQTLEELPRKSTTTQLIVTMSHNLGLLHKNILKNNQKALDFFYKSFDLHLEKNSHTSSKDFVNLCREIWDIHFNDGDRHEEANQQAMAFEHYQKGIDFLLLAHRAFDIFNLKDTIDAHVYTSTIEQLKETYEVCINSCAGYINLYIDDIKDIHEPDHSKLIDVIEYTLQAASSLQELITKAKDPSYDLQDNQIIEYKKYLLYLVELRVKNHIENDMRSMNIINDFEKIISLNKELGLFVKKFNFINHTSISISTLIYRMAKNYICDKKWDNAIDCFRLAINILSTPGFSSENYINILTAEMNATIEKKNNDQKNLNHLQNNKNSF